MFLICFFVLFYTLIQKLIMEDCCLITLAILTIVQCNVQKNKVCVIVYVCCIMYISCQYVGMGRKQNMYLLNFRDTAKSHAFMSLPAALHTLLESS